MSFAAKIAIRTHCTHDPFYVPSQVHWKPLFKLSVSNEEMNWSKGNLDERKLGIFLVRVHARPHAWSIPLQSSGTDLCTEDGILSFPTTKIWTRRGAWSAHRFPKRHLEDSPYGMQKCCGRTMCDERVWWYLGCVRGRSYSLRSERCGTVVNSRFTRVRIVNAVAGKWVNECMKALSRNGTTP